MLGNQSLKFLHNTLLICILIREAFFQKQEYSDYANQIFEMSNISHSTKTYLNFEKEQSLCEFDIHKQINSSGIRKCPKNGIITVRQGGRLGNQIWEYISVWLVAQKSGLEPYVPSCLKERLSHLFDNLTLPTFEEIHHCPMKQKFVVNDFTILQKYVGKPELLAKQVNDVNKMFTIKKQLLNESQTILRQSKQFTNLSTITFIGIHVRRTDYLAYLRRKYKIIPNATNFFKSAITYFENKYPKSIFIIVSDDTDWCWKNFGHMENVYIPGKYNQTSPELDMTLMASCNHSIIDYGTFGQWGALFAGGETLFYPLGQNTYSERLGVQLKNWHAWKLSCPPKKRIT